MKTTSFTRITKRTLLALAITVGLTSVAAADSHGKGKLDPRARAEKIFAKLDLNKDQLIGPFERAKARPRMQALLAKADTDNNRFVTRYELARTLEAFHAGKSKWKGKGKWKNHDKDKKWKGQDKDKKWKGKDQPGNHYGKDYKPGYAKPPTAKPPIAKPPISRTLSRPVMTRPGSVVRDHRATEPAVPTRPNQRVIAIRGGK